jgi:preprotein translocase subunit SecG
MTTFLTVLHVMVCIVIVVVVLLQRGKGAEIGAVFGGGASSTVFGSRGAGNFLTKITTGAAVTFMCTSLALAYFNAGARQGERLFDPAEAEAPAESPAAAEEPESPFGEFGEFGEAPPGEPTPEAAPEPQTAPAP